VRVDGDGEVVGEPVIAAIVEVEDIEPAAPAAEVCLSEVPMNQAIVVF
jgi:hypothetical protein